LVRSALIPAVIHALGTSPRQTKEHITMSENFDKLTRILEEARGDVEKAESGNKAATSRVRKAMQDLKAAAQDVRKEMLELRDSGGKQ
jgi:hypothetical protein